MVAITPPPTARLQFRLYRADDVDAAVEMFDGPEARRWYPTKSERTEAICWIQWNLDNYDRDGFGLWAMEERSTGTFIGDCGLTYQSVEGEQLLEIGYHLQAHHRGNGYALEAARACSDFAVGELGVPTVCSIVDPRNQASIRVASDVHQLFRTFVNDQGAVLNLYWSVR